MLTTLAIANYRSLRKLIIPLGQLTVITGANGSGKSSVYRALRLLADTTQGRVIQSLAQEGGLSSTLWAGPEQFSSAMLRGEQDIQGTCRHEPVNLKLGFASDTFGYAIDLGLPIPSQSRFTGDPEIKRECIWHGPLLRNAALLVDRHNFVIRARAQKNTWLTLPGAIAPFDSMMTEFLDPRSVPEMLTLREQIRSWRFYDHFRSDRDAPARFPQIGTRTPILAHDGADLAAALQTIREMGDAAALKNAIADAFPGATISIHCDAGGWEVRMHQHGLLRPLKAAELSDGTLRYILLMAALLTPRPPALMVMNEPETSLHPDLFPALGRLIATVAKQTQMIVVSHAPRLIAALEQESDTQAIMLEKTLGETKLSQFSRLDAPSWAWPKR